MERGVNVKVYTVPTECTMLNVLFSLQRFYFYNTEAALEFNKFKFHLMFQMLNIKFV